VSYRGASNWRSWGAGHDQDDHRAPSGWLFTAPAPGGRARMQQPPGWAPCGPGGGGPGMIARDIEGIIVGHIGPPLRQLALPWPPSVNHYWRAGGGGRQIISDEGRAYRERVWLLCLEASADMLREELLLLLRFYPPDRRRRDLDNLLKAPLDAMQAGRIYRDDSQIKALYVSMGGKVEGGRCNVRIWAPSGMVSDVGPGRV